MRGVTGGGYCTKSTFKRLGITLVQCFSAAYFEHTKYY